MDINLIILIIGVSMAFIGLIATITSEFLYKGKHNGKSLLFAWVGVIIYLLAVFYHEFNQ